MNRYAACIAIWSLLAAGIAASLAGPVSFAQTATNTPDLPPLSEALGTEEPTATDRETAQPAEGESARPVVTPYGEVPAESLCTVEPVKQARLERLVGQP